MAFERHDQKNYEFIWFSELVKFLTSGYGLSTPHNGAAKRATVQHTLRHGAHAPSMHTIWLLRTFVAGFDRFSLGFDRFSIGFDRLSIGFNRCSIGFHRFS